MVIYCSGTVHILLLGQSGDKLIVVKKCCGEFAELSLVREEALKENLLKLTSGTGKLVYWVSCLNVYCSLIGQFNYISLWPLTRLKPRFLLLSGCPWTFFLVFLEVCIVAEPFSECELLAGSPKIHRCFNLAQIKKPLYFCH